MRIIDDRLIPLFCGGAVRVLNRLLSPFPVHALHASAQFPWSRAASILGAKRRHPHRPAWLIPSAVPPCRRSRWSRRSTGVCTCTCTSASGPPIALPSPRLPRELLSPFAAKLWPCRLGPSRGRTGVRLWSPHSAGERSLPLRLHRRPVAVSVQPLLPPQLPEIAAGYLVVSLVGRRCRCCGQASASGATHLRVLRDYLRRRLQLAYEDLSLRRLIFEPETPRVACLCGLRRVPFRQGRLRQYFFHHRLFLWRGMKRSSRSREVGTVGRRQQRRGFRRRSLTAASFSGTFADTAAHLSRTEVWQRWEANGHERNYVGKGRIGSWLLGFCREVVLYTERERESNGSQWWIGLN